LDLRTLLVDPADFSQRSPIEPSELGGRKIALAIRQILRCHVFSAPFNKCSIYSLLNPEPSEMVFGGPHHEELIPSATWEEAEQMHEEMCQRVRDTLAGDA
jgi:hypothetical protein